VIKINVKWMSEPWQMTVTGHAYAPRNADGHDLLCCAVSTIVQTLGVSCASLMDVNTTFHTSKGFADILVTNTEPHRDVLLPRFEMALDGLRILQAQYPEHIELETE
jgi:uncharacterized protein YsxB (DUF464 family)